jgi:hypothetical protein
MWADLLHSLRRSSLLLLLIGHFYFTGRRALMGIGVVAGDGRQVENPGPEAGWQAQVDAQARAMFLEHAGKKALAELLPARDQLRFEHDFRLGDFIAVAERSPIVPSDRARMLGQGLYAGLCGDMVQAMHILMPQFEHIVRQVLRGAGAFTAQQDKEGLDMEVALGSLVERSQMAEEFGDGLTLAIHAIMCDRAGPNLRNDVAHGLADEDKCDSAHALYAWWLILQLVTETCAAAMDVGGGPGAGVTVGDDPPGVAEDETQMAQNTDILLPALSYTRANYTALCAFVLKLPLQRIADLYHSEDSSQLEQGL